MGNLNRSTLTLGSLFDGSGGFPLGAALNGVEPLWASEIEPFPIKVTMSRFPGMGHYGDVSTLDGHELEPVDIISFGSPCQDMSIAGKRSGLDGERSGLFHQAIRIVKEMREATNGTKPRFIIWENVPGAFSSNGGDDFLAVLTEVCKIKDTEVPIPKPRKWENAGRIMGDGYSVAWRLLDAQFWGVPQRRQRIYLVADFDGRCAGKILFESEGLPGDTPQGFKPWETAPGTSKTGTGETGVICLNDQGGERMDVTRDMTCTLRATSNHPPLVFENHSQDSRYKGPLKVAQTVMSRFGTGGNNQPIVMEPKAYGICSKGSNSMMSDNPNSGFYEAETARTLDANGGNPTCNQGGIVVIEGNGSRPSHKGNGYSESDVMYTLNATEQHAVAFADVHATLSANDGPKGPSSQMMSNPEENFVASRNPVYCTSKNSHHTVAEEGLANTLVATDYKDPPCVAKEEGEAHYIVRRLTPTECARLQGFPDWWCDGIAVGNPTEDEVELWRGIFETHAKALGKNTRPKTDAQIRKWLADPHTDSAEYKMWGNGVALPNVSYVIGRIVHYSQSR